MRLPMRRSGEAVAFEARRESAERFGERPRPAAGQVHEHEAAPARDRDREQGELLEREVRRRHPPRRGDQAPVEVVRPGVIGADDAAARERTLLRGAENRAAMTAGVVESAQAAVLRAQDDDRLRPDRDDAVVAGRRDLLLARDGDPAGVPERLQLLPVVRRVVEPCCGEADLEPFQRLACRFQRWESPPQCGVRLGEVRRGLPSRRVATRSRPVRFTRSSVADQPAPASSVT